MYRRNFTTVGVVNSNESEEGVVKDKTKFLAEALLRLYAELEVKTKKDLEIMEQLTQLKEGCDEPDSD